MPRRQDGVQEGAAQVATCCIAFSDCPYPRLAPVRSGIAATVNGPLLFPDDHGYVISGVAPI